MCFLFNDAGSCQGYIVSVIDKKKLVWNHSRNDIDKGENLSNCGKPCPSATMFTTYLTLTL